MSLSTQKSLAVASLLEQVARDIYPERGPRAVHPVQWSSLRYFGRAGSQARTVSGLGKYLGVTLGPASRAAAALVRRGFITPKPNPDDRRSSLFDLTDEGREQLTHDPLFRLAYAISSVGDEEEATLSRMLLKISENMNGAVHAK